MEIITFGDTYTIVDQNLNEVARFSNIEDATNYLNQQGIENIIENPFYEVDEDGQPIG